MNEKMILIFKPTFFSVFRGFCNPIKFKLISIFTKNERITILFIVYWFINSYISATRCRRPLLIQTIKYNIKYNIKYKSKFKLSKVYTTNVWHFVKYKTDNLLLYTYWDISDSWSFPSLFESNICSWKYIKICKNR